jgi:pimeloyl-ACP methyl ester carboxylesterase
MRRPAWFLVFCAASAVAATPVRSDQRVPLQSVRSEVVHVRGHAVQALCTDGPRRVVLLHDAGAAAESWRPVLERLGGRVGACAYGRPLGGEGEAGTRGWFEMLDDMHAIHDGLRLEPGYTLVGHSVGGLYARLFAADRPLDVGGLVLVDPAHEDLPEAFVAGMPAAARAAWAADREWPNADGVRETELARHARQARLPRIPVTVITAMEHRDGDGWNARLLTEAARRVHASILRQASSGRHIPAHGSTHDVHLDAPDLVAGEVMRMLRATGEILR